MIFYNLYDFNFKEKKYLSLFLGDILSFGNASYELRMANLGFLELIKS